MVRRDAPGSKLVSSAISQTATPGPPSAVKAEDMEAAFDRCATALYRYFAVRVGGDPHLADDLMQQLWIHARNLAATPAEQIEFRLRAIAKNLLRTHWRRCGRRGDLETLVDPRLAANLAERLVSEELPSKVLENREVCDQLLLALTELPAAEQGLIVEHYFLGRSHVQLAERLDLSERAVEGRLYRARRALRAKLQHLEPF